MLQTIAVVIAEMIIEIHMRCRWRVELSERGVVRPTCVCVCVNRQSRTNRLDGQTDCLFIRAPCGRNEY